MGRQKPTIRIPDTAQMFTVADCAVVLHVSPMTVYRLIKLGELTAFRIGRSMRVRADDLAEYLRQAEVGRS